ncbi:MAG: response regulator [Planctomycetota bacterium]
MSRPHVLIAEDDPVFRRVITFTVAKRGFQVEALSDGRQAWDRLQKGGIDFLVTDHQMPYLSGVELLEKCLRADDVAVPPAILCTAKGLELDAAGLISRYNLVEVLHKPFSPRKLSDLIAKSLEERSQDSSVPTGRRFPGPSIPDHAVQNDGGAMSHG